MSCSPTPSASRAWCSPSRRSSKEARLSFYAIAGTANTIAALIGVYGVWLQLARVRENRRGGLAHPTEVLSLNSFASSYVASWAFFVYGYSIQPFNHFLVWSRLASCLLIWAVLLEIRRDRRSGASRAVLVSASVLLAGGLAGLAYAPALADDSRLVSQTLIVAITLLLGQSLWHQALLIWRSGKTGAVSKRLHQSILLVDATGIAFGLAMGLGDGWPLILLAMVSGALRLAILALFYITLR
jgi:hypothetical protein